MIIGHLGSAVELHGHALKSDLRPSQQHIEQAGLLWKRRQALGSVGKLRERADDLLWPERCLCASRCSARCSADCSTACTPAALTSRPNGSRFVTVSIKSGPRSKDEQSVGDTSPVGLLFILSWGAPRRRFARSIGS